MTKTGRTEPDVDRLRSTHGSRLNRPKPALHRTPPGRKRSEEARRRLWRSVLAVRSKAGAISKAVEIVGNGGEAGMLKHPSPVARQINFPSSYPAKYASACAVPSSYGMVKRGP